MRLRRRDRIAAALCGINSAGDITPKSDADAGGRDPISGRFVLGSKGRQPGAKCKATLVRESLFNGEAYRLTQKAIEVALTGDVLALKLCLDRCAPVHKATVKPVKIPGLTAAASYQAKADAVLAAVAAGTLAPDVATALIGAIGNAAHVAEITALTARVQQLEEKDYEQSA